MNPRSLAFLILSFAFSFALAGCSSAPGKPAPSAAALRPEQVLDFPTLYKGNCAGCHGESGKNGAAISLANPVYLSTAGFDNIVHISADGLPGTLMPGFGLKAGGSLTDAQLMILVHGMIDQWGKQKSAAPGLIPYASHTVGSPAQGQTAFLTFCASCHGKSGAGAMNKTGRSNSIVDPAYLALISNQGLRSLILSGMPEQGMTASGLDSAGPGARPMTDQEVTDVVAWLASNRIADPGQPYSIQQK